VKLWDTCKHDVFKGLMYQSAKCAITWKHLKIDYLVSSSNALFPWITNSKKI